MTGEQVDLDGEMRVLGEHVAELHELERLASGMRLDGKVLTSDAWRSLERQALKLAETASQHAAGADLRALDDEAGVLEVERQSLQAQVDALLVEYQQVETERQHVKEKHGTDSEPAALRLRDIRRRRGRLSARIRELDGRIAALRAACPDPAAREE